MRRRIPNPDEPRRRRARRARGRVEEEAVKHEAMRAGAFPGVLAIYESRSSNMLGAAADYAAERGGRLRAPHYTTSIAGIGGDTRRLRTGELRPYPGEVELARGGVLYLDEVVEFSRLSLDKVYQRVMESEDPPFVVAVVRYGGRHEPPLEHSMRRLERTAPWLLRLPRIERAEQLVYAVPNPPQRSSGDEALRRAKRQAVAGGEEEKVRYLNRFLRERFGISGEIDKLFDEGEIAEALHREARDLVRGSKQEVVDLVRGGAHEGILLPAHLRVAPEDAAQPVLPLPPGLVYQVTWGWYGRMPGGFGNPVVLTEVRSPEDYLESYEQLLAHHLVLLLRRLADVGRMHIQHEDDHGITLLAYGEPNRYATVRIGVGADRSVIPYEFLDTFQPNWNGLRDPRTLRSVGYWA